MTKWLVWWIRGGNWKLWIWTSGRLLPLSPIISSWTKWQAINQTRVWWSKLKAGLGSQAPSFVTSGKKSSWKPVTIGMHQVSTVRPVLLEPSESLQMIQNGDVGLITYMSGLQFRGILTVWRNGLTRTTWNSRKNLPCPTSGEEQPKAAAHWGQTVRKAALQRRTWGYRWTRSWQ